APPPDSRCPDLRVRPDGTQPARSPRDDGHADDGAVARPCHREVCRRPTVGRTVMPKLEQTANIAVGLRLKVDERQDLIAQRDRIIQEIATLSDEISTTMAMADEKQVRVGPWLLTLVENSGRLTLDKHRLLEL